MEKKEYLFDFKGGGWNSVYASSKSEAIKSAKEYWKPAEVDVNSFRVSTKADFENSMLNFW